jgi:hypothetical protein
MQCLIENELKTKQNKTKLSDDHHRFFVAKIIFYGIIKLKLRYTLKKDK